MNDSKIKINLSTIKHFGNKKLSFPENKGYKSNSQSQYSSPNRSINSKRSNTNISIINSTSRNSPLSFLLQNPKRVRNSDLAEISRNIRNSLDSNSGVIKRIGKTNELIINPYQNSTNNLKTENSIDLQNVQNSSIVTGSTINSLNHEEKEIKKLK